jgi:UDP-N-acetylmuramoylalanine--D-glutamate ligase
VSARPRPPLPPGPWLVVGLARSGAAAAAMLRGHGEVIGVDAGHPELPAALEGVDLHLGTDGVDLLERAATVVKSPGVPQEAPVIAAARERGVEVVGELELAWRLLPGPEFVAVTGTNGKTTTAELLGAIHRAAGIEVAVAGNVGTPLSRLAADGARPLEVVVCECSSFQLEDASAFAPECALLLNLDEDHLDRHGSFERYREAKLAIFANQGPGDVAVAPPQLLPQTAAERVAFGPAGADLELAEGALRWRGEQVIAAADLRLRGAHNLENAMGAAAASLARGIDGEAVRAALATFAGVPHRLEEVAELDGVLYVNDSKATNVASARVGLEAFDGGVHAILGGSLKGGGFAALRDAVEQRCAAAYLIGEAEDELARDLEGATPLRRCGTLDRAVAVAAAAASAAEVVLLSPACASYDQFEDFEERGRRFAELVEGLRHQASK